MESSQNNLDDYSFLKNIKNVENVFSIKEVEDFKFGSLTSSVNDLLLDEIWNYILPLVYNETWIKNKENVEDFTTIFTKIAEDEYKKQNKIKIVRETVGIDKIQLSLGFDWDNQNYEVIDDYQNYLIRFFTKNEWKNKVKTKKKEQPILTEEKKSLHLSETLGYLTENKLLNVSGLFNKTKNNINLFEKIGMGTFGFGFNFFNAYKNLANWSFSYEKEMSPTEFVGYMSSADFESELSETDLTYTYLEYTFDTNFTPIYGGRVDWIVLHEPDFSNYVYSKLDNEYNEDMSEYDQYDEYWLDFTNLSAGLSELSDDLGDEDAVRDYTPPERISDRDEDLWGEIYESILGFREKIELENYSNDSGRFNPNLLEEGSVTEEINKEKIEKTKTLDTIFKMYIGGLALKNNELELKPINVEKFKNNEASLNIKTKGVEKKIHNNGELNWDVQKKLWKFNKLALIFSNSTQNKKQIPDKINPSNYIISEKTSKENLIIILENWIIFAENFLKNKGTIGGIGRIKRLVQVLKQSEQRKELENLAIEQIVFEINIINELIQNMAKKSKYWLRLEEYKYEKYVNKNLEENLEKIIVYSQTNEETLKDKIQKNLNEKNYKQKDYIKIITNIDKNKTHKGPHIFLDNVLAKGAVGKLGNNAAEKLSLNYNFKFLNKKEYKKYFKENWLIGGKLYKNTATKFEIKMPLKELKMLEDGRNKKKKIL